MSDLEGLVGVCERCPALMTNHNREVFICSLDKGLSGWCGTSRDEAYNKTMQIVQNDSYLAHKMIFPNLTEV